MIDLGSTFIVVRDFELGISAASTVVKKISPTGRVIFSDLYFFPRESSFENGPCFNEFDPVGRSKYAIVDGRYFFGRLDFFLRISLSSSFVQPK